MTFDPWPITRGGQLCVQEILKLAAWSIVTKQNSLIPKIRPVDDLARSQGMVTRQNNQNSFTPKRGGFAIEGLRVACYDVHVDDAIAEGG